MALYVRCGLLRSRLLFSSFKRSSTRPISASRRQGGCSVKSLSTNAALSNDNCMTAQQEWGGSHDYPNQELIRKFGYLGDRAKELRELSMRKKKFARGEINLTRCNARVANSYEDEYLAFGNEEPDQFISYNEDYCSSSSAAPQSRLDALENENEDVCHTATLGSWTDYGQIIQRLKAENDLKINPTKQMIYNDKNHVMFKSDERSDLETSGGLAEESVDETVKIDLNNNNNEAEIKVDSPFKKAQDKVRANLGRIYDKILVVNDIKSAKMVVKKLTTEYRDFIHGCDTEVSKIDVKKETPVGHGKIISFSIFSSNGERKAEFGDGKCCIWVDVLDGEKNLLKEFKPFFEDNSIKKVWHNYSFDSHVIQNCGIKLTGFHADTMHLARIYDSNRRMDGGYSLEALTSNHKIMDGKPDRSKSNNFPPNNSNNIYNDVNINLAKTSMKSIFGKKKLKKNGSEGVAVTLDSVETLQREDRELWICYSALDSISTLRLYESLERKLKGRDWIVNGECRGTMLDFYTEYWRPFGELLVKMERNGVYVNRKYLKEIEEKATKEQRIAGEKFRSWASSYCPDAKFMNVGSDTQIRQLLFGGILNSNDHSESLPTEKKFKIPNPDFASAEPQADKPKTKQSKFKDITLYKIGSGILSTESFTPSGWPSVSADSLKVLSGKIPPDLIYSQIPDPISPISQNPDLETRDSNSRISENRDLENRDLGVQYGTAYEAFGGGEEGRRACVAVAALCEICSIDSLISNFIKPLQGNEISCKQGRVHCSLNINTETGRLSARTPNLQNQPALEKDRYKIRKAFIAEEGKSLIVADYGQLELRILAHMTDCKSMLEAFELGGDFHSRTAMNMYDYISKDVEEGRVLLEWTPKPGEDKPPLPLIKDVYGAERRKAKMLNFSIAYGKTAMGLALDWKVTKQEAEETVKRWYRGRHEVLEWQKRQRTMAREKCYVRTLLGRERHFPKMDNLTPSQKGHIGRAAINTPIQGSAADVAMCAMLEIERNQELKNLGWRLLLQVHDEVILEGPDESAELAKGIVVQCMAKPFNGENNLRVELAVDAKCAKSWYEAK